MVIRVVWMVFPGGYASGRFCLPQKTRVKIVLSRLAIRDQYFADRKIFCAGRVSLSERLYSACTPYELISGAGRCSYVVSDCLLRLCAVPPGRWRCSHSAFCRHEGLGKGSHPSSLWTASVRPKPRPCLIDPYGSHLWAGWCFDAGLGSVAVNCELRSPGNVDTPNTGVATAIPVRG